MKKTCVICGAEFSAPPSSKKITCSRECSRKQKSLSHQGIHYSWPIKARVIHSERMKARGFSDSAKLGLSAALSLPEGQRGPQHRDAKVWTIIDPDGRAHTVINLTDWARQNAHLFDTILTDADRERVAHNIRSGFGQIALSMNGKRARPVYSYKGWALVGLPRSKKEE